MVSIISLMFLILGWCFSIKGFVIISLIISAIETLLCSLVGWVEDDIRYVLPILLNITLLIFAIIRLNM